jgi:hypothetical protein
MSERDDRDYKRDTFLFGLLLFLIIVLAVRVYVNERRLEGVVRQLESERR